MYLGLVQDLLTTIALNNTFCTIYDHCNGCSLRLQVCQSQLDTTTMCMRNPDNTVCSNDRNSITQSLNCEKKNDSHTCRRAARRVAVSRNTRSFWKVPGASDGKWLKRLQMLCRLLFTRDFTSCRHARRHQYAACAVVITQNQSKTTQ